MPKGDCSIKVENIVGDKPLGDKQSKFLYELDFFPMDSR